MTLSQAFAPARNQFWTCAKPANVFAALVYLMVFASTTFAQVITTNGGFESGFAGWTRLDQLGGDGSFLLQTGTVSPVNSTTVPAPPGALQAAMTDAQGPGSHVLYQDVTVPLVPFASAQLRFDIFIGNRATAFFTPAPAQLDFSTPILNQQARVDILTGTADPFSVAGADVLLNAFQTMPGNSLVSGYTTVTTDVSALLLANLGNTLRLRFAEVDNVFTFQFGVDNVSITLTPVPEPSSLALVAFGSIVAGRCISRRKRQQENRPDEVQMT